MGYKRDPLARQSDPHYWEQVSLRLDHNATGITLKGVNPPLLKEKYGVYCGEGGARTLTSYET